jgi:hypothetical protein
MPYRALSLKQPWATLLAAGLKTIEVRRWKTAQTGELLIHAARVPDGRPQAWAHVPPALRDACRLEGGVVGVGVLTGCKHYPTLASFVADEAHHLNDPSWFEASGLFGLCFRDLRTLPFVRVPGYVRIFELPLHDLVIPPVLPAQEPLPGPQPGTSEAVFQRIRRLLHSLTGRRRKDEG